MCYFPFLNFVKFICVFNPSTTNNFENDYNHDSNPDRYDFFTIIHDQLRLTKEMKFNCKELAEYSNGEATIEGRLHHKRITGGFSHSGFKEKWFKLRANVLFYFSATETGKTYEKKPSGAFVLENSIIQFEMNSEAPFSFSIMFNDDLDKKHLFAGRTEEYINQWVNLLKQASYEFWRSQLIMLQTKLSKLTGKDPLLMYPRNEGSPATCRNLDSHSPKTKKLSPTFRSYVLTEEEKKTKLKDVPVQNVLDFTNETFVNGLELIGSEIRNVQIAPPPAPPKRPARGNRTKHDPETTNLIEL